MPDYDILNSDTGEVENTIVFDGDTKWLEENFGEGNWRLYEEPPRTFEATDVSEEAERRIQTGTQINGTQFKTDLESVGRLSEMLDGFDAGLPEASQVKAVTAEGVLLVLDTREKVQALYHAAIKYRASIVTRSAQIQQLDPVPDPSQDILWDLTKTLSEAMEELS
ncbi:MULTISPECIES: hypothetical protein [unclassified Pseudovibrio]|uniref:hypothetical protein n=1 Tax=unclassified Pseudovibrio TaxID=2627060 RepID=UPI0007AEB726|nr:MULTISPECIES: hypothetical protein [unclassified Pseudovibrio]KZK97945.1 hypothetical protein PsAD5_02184 [Pseudovibrio sp. Ad5]KZL02261.1 hypothetical protein PsW74_01359 [Pseudovibrio sp. W74]KZL08195.1 hypothetical protein PsAD14_03342 [Pseudovibrio sp. Ad14]